jgi:DNA-binding MarR family transcriptional regulator
VALIRLTKRAHKEATEDVLGIKLKSYVTLGNLRDGAKPQQDLCLAMNMDPNNCVLLLNELEDAGHVERRRDPADRRRHIVALTDSGRAALDFAERARESLEDVVLGARTTEERAQLHELVGRALGAVQAPA